MRYTIKFTTCSLGQVIGSRLLISYEIWDDDLEVLPLMEEITNGVSVCTKS